MSRDLLLQRRPVRVHRLHDLFTDQIAQPHALPIILVAHVLNHPTLGAGHKLAHAHARAVELPNLVHRAARELVAVHRDEVRGPQQRQRLILQLHHLEQARHVLLDELLAQARKLRRVRLVKRRHVVPAHRAHAPVSLGFLVDDLEQLVPHHQHANLALRDAGHEPLIHEVRTLAGEVLPGEHAVPRASLCHVIRPVDAKLHELTHRVVLHVLVVHLHELESIADAQLGVAELFAMRLIDEPAQPDALARAAPVLLDDPWLKRGGFDKVCPELLRGVVREGVRQAARHAVDPDQRVLRSHALLHLRRRPHGLTRVHERVHEFIEDLLRACGHPGSGQLSRVDAHDVPVVPAEFFSHASGIGRVVLQPLAGRARVDDAVAYADGVVAVPARVLIDVVRRAAG